MYAGRLRHRVTVLARVENRDPAGGIDYDWNVFADQVPASIQPARVLQAFGGAQQQQNYDVLIEMRWMEGLRTSMRIEWADADGGSPTPVKHYEITGVRNADEVRHHVFLQCIERQADGWRRA